MKISILLLLFISMIQIPAHAGLYDYFTRFKEIARNINYKVWKVRQEKLHRAPQAKRQVWRNELNTIVDECNADEKTYRQEWSAKANDANQLTLAINSSNKEDMRTLLYFRANPNCPGFIAAAKAGKTDIVKTLIDRGADINSCDGSHQETALHFACSDSYSDSYRKVKFLLDNGAKVDPRTDADETPLHRTAFGRPDTNPHEFGKIVKELINHDADIFIKDGFGNTPAHNIMYRCGRNSARQALAALKDHRINYEQWLNNKKHAAQLFLYYACLKAPLSQILSMKNNKGNTPVQMAEEDYALKKFLKECEEEKPEAFQELMNVGNEANTKILQMKKRSAERLAQAVLRCYDAQEKNPKLPHVEYPILPPEILLRITKFRYGVND